MGTRQQVWNKYEAVILLDGYIEVLEGKNLRQQVIKRVSRELRQMAAHQGIAIDEFFRNENGVFFQMRSMESAYQGHTIDKPATKLFTDVVALYQNQRPEYEVLLREAKAMVTGTPSVEEQFKRYLSSKIGAEKMQSVFWCYKEIENFCQKIHVLRTPLFETTDFSVIQNVQKAIERNKLFKVTHRKYSVIVGAGKYYYDFIKAGEFAAPDTVTTTMEPEPVLIETATPDAVEEQGQSETRDNTETSMKSMPVETDLLSRTEQDARLFREYPIIFKRVFAALRDLTEQSGKAVSTVSIYEYTKHIGRCANIEDILDNASWSREVGPCYLFSIEIETHKEEVNQEPIEAVSYSSTDIQHHQLREPVVEYGNGPKEKVVNYNQIGSLAFTVPLRFSYFGDVKECKSWTDLYVVFFSALYEDYSYLFSPGKAFFSEDGRVDLGTEADHGKMTAPKPVQGTDLYLETNISATDIVARIKMLLDHCAVNYENVVITYKEKAGPTQLAGNRSSETGYSATRYFDSSGTEKRFHAYMQETLQMAEASCRSYVSAIRNCEKFAADHGYSSKRLYGADLPEARLTMAALLKDPEFLEYNAQQHNRFKAALTKYTQFLGDDGSTPAPVPASSDEAYQNEEYEAVLKENFSKGFRIGSPIEIRRFRRCYAALHGRELEDSDDVVDRTIHLMSIVYENRAYLPQLMVSPKVKEKIFGFIEENFNSGKTNIYYQAIFSTFSTDFLDCHIYDAEMLRTYLMSVNVGQFYIGRSSITKDPTGTADPVDEVREFLVEADRSVTYDEMYTVLTHLPKDRIRWILGTNAEFINNARGCYFHQSCLHITDEELEAIADIIAAAIDEKEFISGTELYQAVKAKYPYTIENNSEISVYGFRDAIKYRLGNRFSFNGNIISRKGQALTMQDVFADFSKNRDSFTLDELNVLAGEMGTQIYFDPVYANSLRVSQTQFVSKDRAAFHVEETDSAIDCFCTGSYLGVRKIKSFVIFPEAGFPWNSYLLQHYVSNYSKKYKLIHNGFNANSSDGAIVKRNAGIDSFDDLVITALADSDIDLNKKSALQYLCDEGYLARRRYSSIEQILIKANALRNNKGA